MFLRECLLCAVWDGVYLSLSKMFTYLLTYLLTYLDRPIYDVVTVYNY